MPPPDGLIPRDPNAEVRTRQTLDALANVLNGLIRSGDITRTTGGGWRIRRDNSTAGSVFLADNPTDSDFPVPGPQGVRGPQGVPGVPLFLDDPVEGEQGPPGTPGKTGATGPTGQFLFPDDPLEGEPGPPGPTGPAGQPGPVGRYFVEDPVDGEDGRPGPTGSAGPIGPIGQFILPEDGLDGDQGPPGPKGDTGATGATGAAGSSTSGAAGMHLLVDENYADEVIPQPAAAVSSIPAGFLRGYIDGLILSNSGLDSLAISAGCCRDSTDLVTISLSSFTKKLATTWAAGSGSNGLDTGTPNAGQIAYHVFVISKPSGVSPDVLFSLSATAPTMPTGYTLFRRIGSGIWLTNGFYIFVQDGDTFYFTGGVADVNATNPGVAAVTRTLTLPTGIRILALMNVHCYDNGVAGGGPNTARISDLSLQDNAPPTNGPANAGNGTAGVSLYGVNFVEAFTNTSAQVRSRVQVSGANTILKMFTMGWVDQRNKNA